MSQTITKEELLIRQGIGGRWNTGEAPKDGKPIVAVGTVIYEDEFSTSVEGFAAAIFWDKGGYWRRWLGDGQMALTSCLEDKVNIFHWLPFPEHQPQPAA